jgi:hypothetical protein
MLPLPPANHQSMARMEVPMMRRMVAIGMLGIATLVAMPTAPAFASDPSVGPPAAEFQALSGLPDGRRVELVTMTDDELLAVEGTAFPQCRICPNWAKILIAHLRRLHPLSGTVEQHHSTQVRQVNKNVGGDHHTVQRNTAIVVQKN